MTAGRLLTGALAVLAVLVAHPAEAHPLATTEVAIDLRTAGRVEVRLNANAEGLLTKLAALTTSAVTTTGPAAERVRALAETLLAEAELEQDGARVPLSLAGVDEPEPGRVRVRLSGPASAGALRWRTRLIYGSYSLSLWRPGHLEPVATWISGGAWSAPVVPGAPASRWTRLWQGTALGFTHILPSGLDHMLFVVGLFLLAPRWRTVLAQVTAFTLAHSVTLALTLYGVIALPAAVVEPLIALSIAYVAFENLATSTLKPWRLALVFAFGLLHGLGFAEALARLELAAGDRLLTLAAFNVGVEAGQLTVLAVTAGLVAALRLTPEAYRRWIMRPASAVIGLAGVLWVIQRVGM